MDVLRATGAVQSFPVRPRRALSKSPRAQHRALSFSTDPSALRLRRPVHSISHICFPRIDGSSAQTSIFALSRSILAISICFGVSHSGPRICRSEKMSGADFALLSPISSCPKFGSLDERRQPESASVNTSAIGKELPAWSPERTVR